MSRHGLRGIESMNEDMTKNQIESQVTSHESRQSWYVVQTKPAAEELVQQHLRNADYETFLPRIRTMVKGGGRTTSRVKPLFPAYLFVRLDLSDANLYRMIKYTRGVRRILGDGSLPVPVPGEMIEIIRERMNGDGIIEQRMTMNKGDEVRIRSGVFKDLVGILDKPVSAAGRVKVLLRIMHHTITCDISAGDVEKV